MTGRMKSLVYWTPGVGAITEKPIPKLGDRQVLVKIKSCGICKGADSAHDTVGVGSGLARYPIFEKGHEYDDDVLARCVTPGHEFAGDIVEIGKDVSTFRVGDRVTADNTKLCGNCYYCRTLRPNLCTSFGSIGHNIPGGFAEYVVVDEDKTYRIPENLSYDEACFAEPVACCIHAMDRLYALSSGFGEQVMVLGTGTNGIILAQLIKNSNAAEVVSLGGNAQKLALLNSKGIETIWMDRDDYSKHRAAVMARFPYGLDAIVDATASGPLQQDSMTLLKKGGRMLVYSVAHGGGEIVLDRRYMYMNELTYYYSMHQTGNFDRALRALATGAVDVKGMISAEYKLDDYFTAINEVKKNSNLLKVIIHP